MVHICGEIAAQCAKSFRECSKLFSLRFFCRLVPASECSLEEACLFTSVT